MTVKELIEELRKMPSDSKVMLDVLGHNKEAEGVDCEVGSFGQEWVIINDYPNPTT